MSALRGALAVGLACGTVLVPTSALAEEPERAGWWNRLSAGGTALPQPTTAEGDLRISAAPDGPAAYAAVSYPSAGATDAVLTLTLRTDRTVGTPDVAACPTTDSAWKEGGNQPYDAAPAYDCEAAALAELAPDGTTLTFLLDSSTQDATGTWSLALVPTPGGTQPFSVDVAEPEAAAFSSSGGQDAGEAAVPQPPPPAAGEEGSASGGTGEAFLPGGFAPPPPPATGSAELPLVADGAEVPLPEAAVPEPAVAGGAAPGGTPLLLARPAGVVEDLGSGRRLLALLVLAGGSAAVGYAAGQQRPGPRLIGGRSRVTPAAPALVPGPVAVEERPRGIGRFAKTRDAAPRRLR